MGITIADPIWPGRIAFFCGSRRRWALRFFTVAPVRPIHGYRFRQLKTNSPIFFFFKKKEGGVMEGQLPLLEDVEQIKIETRKKR